MILLSISQMIHNIEYGNSPGVQWLGLGPLTVGVRVQSLVGQPRSGKLHSVAKRITMRIFSYSCWPFVKLLQRTKNSIFSPLYNQDIRPLAIESSKALIILLLYPLSDSWFPVIFSLSITFSPFHFILVFFIFNYSSFALRVALNAQPSDSALHVSILFIRVIYILHQTQTAIFSPIHRPFIHLANSHWAPAVCQVLLLIITHTEV